MPLPRRHDDELRELYRAHADAVFAFLAYSVGRQTAEDLTATTFERAIRHWRRYDPARASPRTWLLSIARNALIDHYRRQSHRDATSLDASPVLAASLASAEDPVAGLLDEAAFASWLSELPGREREVIALRYGADLSAAEVGGLLELQEANVHQIASRAVRRLRRRIDERSGDAPQPG